MDFSNLRNHETEIIPLNYKNNIGEVVIKILDRANGVSIPSDLNTLIDIEEGHDHHLTEINSHQLNIAIRAGIIDLKSDVLYKKDGNWVSTESGIVCSDKTSELHKLRTYISNETTIKPTISEQDFEECIDKGYLNIGNELYAILSADGWIEPDSLNIITYDKNDIKTLSKHVQISSGINPLQGEKTIKAYKGVNKNLSGNNNTKNSDDEVSLLTDRESAINLSKLKHPDNLRRLDSIAKQKALNSGQRPGDVFADMKQSSVELLQEFSLTGTELKIDTETTSNYTNKPSLKLIKTIIENMKLPKGIEYMIKDSIILNCAKILSADTTYGVFHELKNIERRINSLTPNSNTNFLSKTISALGYDYIAIDNKTPSSQLIKAEKLKEDILSGEIAMPPMQQKEIIDYLDVLKKIHRSSLKSEVGMTLLLTPQFSKKINLIDERYTPTSSRLNKAANNHDFNTPPKLDR